MKKILLWVFVSPALFFAIPFFVRAEITDSVPDILKNKLIFDLPIYTMVADDETLYIGGDFSSVATSTGPVVVFNTLTGQPDAGFPVFALRDESGNLANVGTVISDGGGGWYVAGGFNSVDGVLVGGGATKSLVHILSDGSTDPNFSPEFSAGFSIFSMALSPDEATLYVAGSFTTVDAVARLGFAAFDTATGDLTDLDLGLNARVMDFTQTADGGTLYLVGSFTTVNGGTTRNRVAAFDATTGLETGFNPNVGSEPTSVALSPDEVYLYVGGSFSTVNGATTRRKLAAFDVTTGTATAFNPNITAFAGISDIIVSSDGATVYSSGSFPSVNGGAVSRLGFAGFASSTGAATALNPQIGGSVNDMILSDDESTFYVGGQFATINNSTVNAGNYAVFDAVTGTATEQPISFDQRVDTLALSGDTIIAGGPFGGINPSDRYYLAAVNLDDYTLKDFDPLINDTVYALALSPDGGTLYVAGDLTCVGMNWDTFSCDGDTRNYVAAIDTDTGEATAFDANLGSRATDLALSSDSTTLFVGGQFTTVNGGMTRNYLAAFDTTTGTATAFDPNLDSNTYGIGLSPDGTKLYAGGSFTNVNGGTTRNRAAAFDVTTGTATAFDPNLNNGITSFAFTADGTTVYAGGYFGLVNGGTARSYLAAFDAVSGVVQDFAPEFNDSLESILLSPDEQTIYAGGYFTSVDGVDREGVAALSTVDGSLTDFDPLLVSDEIYALLLNEDGSELYLGGDPISVGDPAFPFISNFIVFSGDAETPWAPPVVEEEEEEDSGGGSSGSRRRCGEQYGLPSCTPTTTPSTATTTEPAQQDPANVTLEQLQTQLIELLKQLLQILLTQQQS